MRRNIVRVLASKIVLEWIANLELAMCADIPPNLAYIKVRAPSLIISSPISAHQFPLLLLLHPSSSHISPPFSLLPSPFSLLSSQFISPPLTSVLSHYFSLIIISSLILTLSKIAYPFPINHVTVFICITEITFSLLSHFVLFSPLTFADLQSQYILDFDLLKLF